MKPCSLLLAAAALAAAQDAADYFPECSIDCLEDSVSAVSDCTFDDAWCICVQATYEEVTAHGTSCVMKECGADVAVGESSIPLHPLMHSTLRTATDLLWQTLFPGELISRRFPHPQHLCRIK